MKSHNVEDAVLEVIDLLCGNIVGDSDEPKQYANGGLELDDNDDETDGLICCSVCF
jgi:hypothetical protein